MITKEQILIFKKSADNLYRLRDYTSATILYFKTWFAIQDYILLNKVGQTPKDHSERFKLLKVNFPKIYINLDIEFSTYRDTYSKVIDKTDCERIKRIVEHEIINHSIN
ncbi:MAG: hypothetical protein AB1571_01775 [Nanoarchaeota archaeon]